MNTLEIAKRVISNEIDALHAISEQLDEQFDAAIKLILNTQGRTII